MRGSLPLRRRIPFHLIAHDDLAYVSRFPAWSRPWVEARFGDAYRAARSRLCISDTMAEVYEQRFGAPGQVIYPTNKGGSHEWRESSRLADLRPN